MLIKLNNGRIYSAHTAIPIYVTLGQAPKKLHITLPMMELATFFFSILSAAMQPVSKAFFFLKSCSFWAKVEVNWCWLIGDDISKVMRELASLCGAHSWWCWGNKCNNNKNTYIWENIFGLKTHPLTSLNMLEWPFWRKKSLRPNFSHVLNHVNTDVATVCKHNLFRNKTLQGTFNCWLK